MKVFDFNIHLPSVEHEDVNVVVANDMALSDQGLVDGLELHSPKFKKLDGANFLLFNTNLFTHPLPKFSKALKEHPLNYTAKTALVDFRRNDLSAYMERLCKEGVNAVMVNSYIQKIGKSDYAKVLEMFSFAEKNNLIVCIDGSFGTSKMYTYDNLELACFIADHIQNTPIVIVHSGGLRIKEFMLLALEKQNIYLDTSFSLPYYIGSSLEQDFAFAYKKIGTDRIVYGSDIPYLNSDIAVQTHVDFFVKHRFSQNCIDKIMFENAVKLFDLA